MLSQELKALSDEIEAELALEQAAPAITAADVTTLDDLDDLLSESLAIQDERKSGKSLREKLAKAKDESERLETEALLRVWEAKYEWTTTKECLVIHRDVCSCGHRHEHFGGVYLEQQHRTDKHAKRWLNSVDNIVKAIEGLAQDLPKQVFIQDRPVPVCQRCAMGQGWNAFQAKVGVPWQG